MRYGGPTGPPVHHPTSLLSRPCANFRRERGRFAAPIFSLFLIFRPPAPSQSLDGLWVYAGGILVPIYLTELRCNFS